MTNEEKIEQFHIIVNQMANLYAKKNRNYGNSFGELYEKLGPVSGLVPLHNKLNRATSLLTGEENNFESLEDTFKDLACYAVMNIIEMMAEEEKKTSYPNKCANDKGNCDGNCLMCTVKKEAE